MKRRNSMNLDLSGARSENRRLERKLTDARAEVERLKEALELPNLPELEGAKAVVLYFPSEADRDELVAAVLEVHPNMRSVKL